MLLCALSYTKYGDSPALKKVYWAAVVLFGMLVVAARKHYTLDIVVAWYTVPLLWLAYDTCFPDRLPPEIAEAEKMHEEADVDDLKKLIV